MQKYLLSYLLCSLFIWILPQTSQGSNQVISTVKLLCDFFSRHLIYDSGQVFQCCLVLHQTAVRNHTWNRDRAASKDWQSWTCRDPSKQGLKEISSELVCCWGALAMVFESLKRMDSVIFYLFQIPVASWFKPLWSPGLANLLLSISAGILMAAQWKASNGEFGKCN